VILRHQEKTKAVSVDGHAQQVDWIDDDRIDPKLQ